MKKRKIILAAAFLLSLCWCGALMAGDSTNIGKFLQEDSYKQMHELNRLTDPNSIFADDFNDFPMFDEELYQIRHRSTGRAFIYSLIMPGTGQLYSGSKIKAGFFLAVEIFSWYQYGRNYAGGRDKENEFQDFANQYWSPGSYRSYLVEVYGILDDTTTFNDHEGNPQKFSHHLPGFKTQQYYEMIGKYDQFLFGWTDTHYAVNDSVSEYRSTYLKMRDVSNKKFTAARNYAIVSIANRVISAFDAALSVHRSNKRTDRFSEVSLRARMADYNGEQIPKVILTYNFY